LAGTKHRLKQCQGISPKVTVPNLFLQSILQFSRIVAFSYINIRILYNSETRQNVKSLTSIAVLAVLLGRDDRKGMNDGLPGGKSIFFRPGSLPKIAYPGYFLYIVGRGGM
jgi:hypothetical protein